MAAHTLFQRAARSLIPLACVIAAAASVSADELVGISFAADEGWTYHPAVEDGLVVGYLAEHTGSSSAPHGLSVVWYERDGAFFSVTSGWVDTDTDMIAASLALAAGSPDLFDHSDLGMRASAIIDACEEAATLPLRVQNGLDATDPLAEVAILFEPQEMQAYVDAGAVGADVLSALEVGTIEVHGTFMSTSSARLNWLTEVIEADLAGDGPAPATSWYPCFPGTKCRVTVLWGPCTLVGGFGNNSCSGCRYRCTTTTIRACAYIDAFCNVGPTTITTAPGAGTKSCSGDASDCPSTPPGNC